MHNDNERPLYEIELTTLNAVSTITIEEHGHNVDSLNITGIEVLAWIATKVALPIVTGFLSRELYERYKNIKNRAEAQKAREDILSRKTKDTIVVGDEELIDSTVGVLIKEGFTPEQSRTLAETLVAEIARKMDSFKM